MSTVGLIPEGKTRKLHGRRVSEETTFSVQTTSSTPNSRLFPSTGRRGYRAPTNTMGFRPGHTQGGNYVAQRVLSARVLRVKELQNELQETKNHMHELMSENKMLKNLQKRQDTALARYEDSTSALPRLLENHRAEVTALKGHARAVRATARSLHRKLQRTDTELNTLRDQYSKLKQIAGDRELEARSSLQKRVEELEDRLKEMKDKNVVLHRKMEIEIKSHTQQLNVEVTKRKNLQKELTAALAEISRLSSNIEGKHLSSRGNGDSNDLDDLQNTSMTCLLTGALCPTLTNQIPPTTLSKPTPHKQAVAKINTNLKRTIPQLNLQITNTQKQKRNFELSTKKAIIQPPPLRQIDMENPIVHNSSSETSDSPHDEDIKLARNILDGISAAGDELFKDELIFNTVVQPEPDAEIGNQPDIVNLHAHQVLELPVDVGSKNDVIDTIFERKHKEKSKPVENTKLKDVVKRNPLDSENKNSKTVETKRDESTDKRFEIPKSKLSSSSESESETDLQHDHKGRSEKILEWFGTKEGQTKSDLEKPDIYEWFKEGQKIIPTTNTHISGATSRRDSYSNFDSSDTAGDRPRTNVSSLDSYDCDMNKISDNTPIKIPGTAVTSPKSSAVKKTDCEVRTGRRKSVPIKSTRNRNTDSGISSTKQSSNLIDIDSEISNTDVPSQISSAKTSEAKGGSAVRTHHDRFTNQTKNNLLKADDHMKEFDRQISMYKKDRALRNPALFGAGDSSDDDDFKERSMQQYITNLDKLEEMTVDYNTSIRQYDAPSTSKGSKSTFDGLGAKSGDDSDDSSASHKSVASVHYSSDEAFNNKFKELKKDDKTLYLNSVKHKKESKAEDLLDPHAYLEQIDNSWKEIQERMENDRIIVNEKLSQYCKDVVSDVEKSNSTIETHQKNLDATLKETELIEKAVKVNSKINEQLKHGRIDSSKKNQLLAALKAIDTGKDDNLDKVSEQSELIGSFGSLRGNKTQVMRELFDD